MIGWDDGKFCVKGGTARYEAVMYNASRNGNLVKLARLEVSNGRVREVSRYVLPDTVLEFDDSKAFQSFVDEFQITPAAN